MPRLVKPRYFPPPELAEPEGVVLFGGRLSTAWLLDAYSHGIFPWPIFDGVELLVWWSPDPRAIFELDGFHVSRRLARTCRSEKFEVTCDRDFAGVIDGCATAGDRAGHTWITPAMRAAYCELHRQGYAHSVEAWHEGKLVGGVYGVGLGGVFAAESMFHLERDASKVALLRLVHHLRSRGYALMDIQQLTPHTASLGAVEISRGEYLQRLRDAIKLGVTFGEQLAPIDPGEL
jgi:leucyl/phenylalanyl-tRNA--protein transferase